MRLQAIEARVPEVFVTVQPVARFLQRHAFQAAAHDAARLVTLDQAGIVENAEVLDEPRQRHVERRGKLADRPRAVAQRREDRAARGIGQRTEHCVERACVIVNH
jgi:hypothetical protein